MSCTDEVHQHHKRSFHDIPEANGFFPRFFFDLLISELSVCFPQAEVSHDLFSNPYLKQTKKMGGGDTGRHKLNLLAVHLFISQCYVWILPPKSTGCIGKHLETGGTSPAYSSWGLSAQLAAHRSVLLRQTHQQA